MANIPTHHNSDKYRTGLVVNKSAKSLVIDMTPLVDLGFLLITFFIFTSSLTDPSTMHLLMPKDGKKQSLISESGSMTIVVGANNQLYCYEGFLAKNGSNIKVKTLQNIRNEIVRKKQEVLSKYTPDADCESKSIFKNGDANPCSQKNLMILIKPTINSKYKDIISVLDEMAINKIARYTLANITHEEEVLMNAIR